MLHNPSHTMDSPWKLLKYQYQCLGPKANSVRISDAGLMNLYIYKALWWYSDILFETAKWDREKGQEESNNKSLINNKCWAFEISCHLYDDKDKKDYIQERKLN
jgi:hypothetical protein